MADTIAASKDESQVPTDKDGNIVGGSVKAFSARIERCKTKRRELLRDWQLNVDYRRGKATDVDSDENRSPVTVDWSQTNAKIAQLFSQVPQVILNAESKEYRPAAMPVQKRLNARLKKAGIGACMDEVLPDVLNAAGIGIGMVDYEARTVMKTIPQFSIDELGMVDRTLITMGLKKMPTMDVPHVVDRKFSITRIGPEDFLWPIEFEHSDFNQSPWIGRSGRAPWAQALGMFKAENDNRGLRVSDKDKVLGDDRTSQDRLTTDGRQDVAKEQDVVCFDEIFYKRYLFHEDELYFDAIQRLVFVDGIDDPVVNEKWSGQRFDEELGGYIGSCKYPIQVLTFHYISSEAVPPSESAVTRPTVKELMRGRQQMMEQRDHSKPVRWADSNRVDADIMTLLMQGDWQGFIPTQGPGDKALGEVARAPYPMENMEFDRAFKMDLMEARAMGPNQGGAPTSGPRSAAEAKIVQSNFGTVISQQRARCTMFMCNMAEVLLGLMCLYDDFELPDTEDMQRLQNWDRTRINAELAFSVRLDSSVLLDSEQRIDRIGRFLNMAGKSGRVNPEPILAELAALSGLDPGEVITPPPQQNKQQPNISFRFSGEDLGNPMVVGILLEEGMAPSPEGLANAKKLLGESQAAMHESNPAVPTPHDGSTPPMADDRPEWQSVDRINSRRDASQD